MKKINSAAVAVVLLAASLLQACGGGDEGHVQIQAGAVPEATAQGTSAGAGPISLSQPALTVEFLKNDARIEQTRTQTVRIDFQKDDLYIGYAPGAPQVDWLYLPSSKQTLREKSFELRIEVFPTTHATGVQSTTLRIVNRKADGTDATYVDLPVRMKIHDLPTVHSGEVSFSTTSRAAPAQPVVVPLDFGELPSPAVEVSLTDGNSATSQWLQPSVATGGRSLVLTPKAVSAAGQYKGFVKVRYQTLGVTTDKLIPVTLQATAATPTLHHVSPAHAVPGQPIELLITGEGFSLGDIKRVQIGDNVAAAMTRLSDTQLLARFDTLAGSGELAATVIVGDLTLRVDKAMLLAPDVSLPPSAIKVGEDVSEIRYDERSQSLFVATSQRLHRMQLVAGQWKNMATRLMPYPNFDLSGDGQHIVLVDKKHITLLDARTLEEVAVRPLPDLSGRTEGYEWVSLVGVMHNGDMVLALPNARNYTSQIALYRFQSGILDVTDKEVMWLMARQTSRRDKLRMVANRDEGPTFHGDYLSASDTFQASYPGIPGVGIYSNYFALSGDGSRVLLNDYIYDTANGNRISFSNAGYYNSYFVFSPDGQRVYAVSSDERGIGTILVGPGGGTLQGTIAPHPDRPSTQWADITPNGQAVLSLGKPYDYSGGARLTNVYITPVR